MNIVSLDENSLKRLILSIEKQISTNMAMRMKYVDQPERFMESELELFQALKTLHAIAAAPELYPVFVRTKCLPSLLSLLSHENVDIANDVLDLLQEMAAAEDASPDCLVVLVDALLEHDGPRRARRCARRCAARAIPNTARGPVLFCEAADAGTLTLLLLRLPLGWQRRTRSRTACSGLMRARTKRLLPYTRPSLSSNPFSRRSPRRRRTSLRRRHCSRGCWIVCARVASTR